MPIRSAPAASAASSSRSSCTSTSASSPSASACSRSSRSARGASAATISSTASAPVHARLVDLIGVEDEVLAQQRQRHGGAHLREQLEAAAEVVRVRQHRDRGGAARGVGPRAGHRVEVRTDLALARRAALDLGDHARPLAGRERAPEAARRRPPLARALRQRRRAGSARARARARGACGRGSRRGCSRARSARRPRAARACAPRRRSSRLRRASTRPAARSSAAPATHSAPAAFSSTMSRRGPGSPREHRAHDRRVLGARRRRADPRAAPRSIPSERRIDAQPAHAARLEPGRVRVRGGGDLVEPVGAVHDERAREPSCAERRRQRLDQRRRVDADQLEAHADRVEQRAQAVHQRAHAERLAHRRERAHGGMGDAREERRDARPRRAASPPTSTGSSTFDAERLEHVDAAGAARGGAVAVLRDRHAGARDHEGGGGRDVEGLRRRRRRCRRCRRCADPDTARPRRARAHARAPPPRSRPTVSPLVRSATSSAADWIALARPSMISPKAASSSGAGTSRPSMAASIAARRLMRPRLARRSRGSAAAAACRRCVRIDSGWNWTPSIGCSRCRTPMISPSAVRAVTWSTAGQDSPSITSEW